MEYKKGNTGKTFLLSQGINISKWRARTSGNLELLDLIWQQKGQQKNQSIPEPKNRLEFWGFVMYPGKPLIAFPGPNTPRPGNQINVEKLYDLKNPTLDL